MKYKKIFITIITMVISASFFNNLSAILTMSQYKPDSYFEKPYFPQDYFTDISFNFSGGFANSAYNENANKVNFLQQYGPENLLKKFIDPTLSDHDAQSFGQGLLSGNFHVRELIITCYKNMHKGFFIQGATVIQDLLIDQISLNFVPSITTPTEEQIKYLSLLQQKIPKIIDQSGMFTTAFYAGFHTTFCNFHHLDFIDFQCKAGFMSPQAMSSTNQSMLQVPFMQNLNFGYPIIVTASLGLLDWMTIGCNGGIIPWQPATATIAMNSSTSQNILLVPQSGVAVIDRGPLFATAIYFEADHVYEGFSTLIAYCYTRNSNYKISPIDTINFEKKIVNQSTLLESWSLGSLYLQFDIDLACNKTPSAPVITVFCNIPISGQLCPETNIFGGSCNLQISYIF